MISISKTRARTVEPWQDGKMIKRKVAAAILNAERNFSRIMGVKAVVAVLAALVPHLVQLKSDRSDDAALIAPLQPRAVTEHHNGRASFQAGVTSPRHLWPLDSILRLALVKKTLRGTRGLSATRGTESQLAVESIFDHHCNGVPVGLPQDSPTLTKTPSPIRTKHGQPTC